MHEKKLHTFGVSPWKQWPPNNGGFKKKKKNLTALLGSFSVALWTFLLCAHPKAIHTSFDFSDSYSHLDFSCL